MSEGIIYCAVIDLNNGDNDENQYNVYIGKDYDLALKTLIDLGDRYIRSNSYGTIFNDRILGKTIEHWEDGEKMKEAAIDVDTGEVKDE